jgi:hypothetical protein
VHTRRVASFLLGIWIGCSLFIGVIAFENLRSPSLVLSMPTEGASKILQLVPPEQAQLLLRHLAAEQNRLYFYVWEWVEILLALLLGGCLLLATQRRILPLVLCSLMLAVVLVEHIAISPELAYRGRATDFPPGSLVFGAQARVWVLSQIYVGMEITKLVMGGILISYLFYFRRRVRKETEVAGRADHTHAGR